MKKANLILAIVFSIFFFSIFPLVFSESIVGYTVVDVVPLNQNLTIYGIYSEGEDNLCSFYIFDINNQSQVLIRLTDIYTAPDGSFYAEWTIKEPLFKRGADYNAITVCGPVKAYEVFHVGQKEDVAFGIRTEAMIWDLVFWTNPENSVTAAFFGILFLIAIFSCVFLLRKLNIKI